MSHAPAARKSWQVPVAASLGRGNVARPPASAASPATAPAPAAKAPRRELAAFTAQLAIMLRSGVDVATALRSLTRQCRCVPLARVLEQVQEAVHNGASFSDALRRHERLFGASYVATVAAGEASGNMAHVLAQLSQVQRNELRMARTVRGLLTYPLLLTGVSSLVVATLVLFVLPQFAAIFAQYEMPLPLVTQALLSVAGELRTRWWVWGPLVAAAVAALMALRVSPTGRRWCDRLLLSAPLLRPTTQSLLTGRVYRLLGLMLESGVPLVDCLRLVRRSVSNSLMVDLFNRLEKGVMEGKSLAAGMQDTDVLPTSAVEMLATAERTGNLGEVSRLVGEHFEEEGEAQLRQLVGVAEPLITLVMGGVVSIVVLAVMLPMFDLATFAQK